MKCNNCGATIKGQWKFCKACGSPVEKPPDTPHPAHRRTKFLITVIILIALAVTGTVSFKLFGSKTVTSQRPVSTSRNEEIVSPSVASNKEDNSSTEVGSIHAAHPLKRESVKSYYSGNLQSTVVKLYNESGLLTSLKADDVEVFVAYEFDLKGNPIKIQFTNADFADVAVIENTYINDKISEVQITAIEKDGSQLGSTSLSDGVSYTILSMLTNYKPYDNAVLTVKGTDALIELEDGVIMRSIQPGLSVRTETTLSISGDGSKTTTNKTVFGDISMVTVTTTNPVGCLSEIRSEGNDYYGTFMFSYDPEETMSNGWRLLRGHLSFADSSDSELTNVDELAQSCRLEYSFDENGILRRSEIDIGGNSGGSFTITSYNEDGDVVSSESWTGEAPAIHTMTEYEYY